MIDKEKFLHYLNTIIRETKFTSDTKHKERWDGNSISFHRGGWDKDTYLKITINFEEKVKNDD